MKGILLFLTCCILFATNGISATPTCPNNFTPDPNHPLVKGEGSETQNSSLTESPIPLPSGSGINSSIGGNHDSVDLIYNDNDSSWTQISDNVLFESEQISTELNGPVWLGPAWLIENKDSLPAKLGPVWMGPAWLIENKDSLPAKLGPVWMIPNKGSLSELDAGGFFGIQNQN